MLSFFPINFTEGRLRKGKEKGIKYQPRVYKACCAAPFICRELLSAKSTLPINDILITFQGVHLYFGKITLMSYMSLVPSTLFQLLKNILFPSVQFSNTSLILLLLIEN